MAAALCGPARVLFSNWTGGPSRHPTAGHVASTIAIPGDAAEFWPVKVGNIDTQALTADRDQLFAEAVRLYECEVPWWPDAKFEQDVIAAQQEARYDVDTWEEPLQKYLRSRLQLPPKQQCVTVIEVADVVLDIRTRQVGTNYLPWPREKWHILLLRSLRREAGRY